MTYEPRRPPRRETLRARELDFQLYRWGADDAVPLILLHGWGDSGETWQFVVDALRTDRHIVAYDARGFGRSEWPQDGYWFPDYLADLDALLDRLAPAQSVDLVGHSMGGNVALLYAGIRPERVRRVINLEGFGLDRTRAEQAPGRYAEWLDEVRDGVSFATYESFEQFETVLARRNPRTGPAHLRFIARSWARERPDGRIELRADPRHKRVNPVLYQREQAEACWRQIAAPVLYVVGTESALARRMGGEISHEMLQGVFRHVRKVAVEDAGHMLHHERPAAVAELLETFFR